MIGVGFVGLGVMGMGQVKAFGEVEGCRVVAGADPVEPAREAFARAAPEATAYESYKDLLSDRRVDVVVIAVPTDLHKPMATEALRAGRPLLVEKPLARTVAECREIVDAGERARRLVMVAHCRRFDCDWGCFAKTYISGELGRQILWRLVRGGNAYAKWFMEEDRGRGPMFDGAIHNYDFANWLFGPAESVMGQAIKLDPTATAIDTASAIVRYRNGSQLLVSFSWSMQGAWLHDALGSKAALIFGSEGMDVPEGMKAHTIVDRQGHRRLVTYRPKDMYVEQARRFIDCLNGRSACKIPAAEATKAVAVGEAVLNACREGAVVGIESV